MERRLKAKKNPDGALAGAIDSKLSFTIDLVKLGAAIGERYEALPDDRKKALSDMLMPLANALMNLFNEAVKEPAAMSGPTPKLKKEPAAVRAQRRWKKSTTT